jgi:phage virion morphogenesis protein
LTPADNVASISVSLNDRTVLAALDRIAKSFTPARMRPVMKDIGEELAESTRQRFNTATSPDGTPWAPLKPRTVLARYQKMMGGLGKSSFKKDGSLSKRGEAAQARIGTASQRPLIDTGELSRTIRSQVTDGGAGVEIGTNRTFSKGVGTEVHQFGTRNGRIPARPFLGLSDHDRTTVLDILQSFLVENLPP